METLAGNLYDFPKYYDLVFGSDWKAEYSFLLQCFARHAQGTVRHVFEPACGTGRLLFRLGRAGYDVSGLDLNAGAIDYCNRRLQRHGLPATAFVADMADFRLARRVDAAYNMINSFRHLRSTPAARRHLQRMAQSLRRGGIYVLGLHLTPTVGQPLDEESWSARRGHLCVNTRMWTLQRDLRRREERCAMVYDVHTPTRHLRLADQLVFRTYTARQFQRLVDDVPALAIEAIYDFTYDVETPVELWPETEDAVFVFRKR